MNVESPHATPAEAAQLHWQSEGEFHPVQFTGDQRTEYEAEAARIERQWDNQPN
ncbi:hypothetical protein [Pseudomonas sp. CCC4.4]|uniref:hypothetical protein n=1 Tax=Pseudomonas sp. CCC4.4 TaxID=3048612 RepID=UPI002B23D588|nr:hypothetical protein [Pseudomonas sp. CCC4.4]MEB0170059.1 hypothetical protein [Pseudomonas sp. CCC4.4]